MMTVGQLKEALKDIPDDAHISVQVRDDEDQYGVAMCSVEHVYRDRADSYFITIDQD